VNLRCPHAPPCPGCPRIGEAYADGLADKRASAARELTSYPELAATVLEPPLGASTLEGYRVRAKLVTDNQSRLGLFAAATHDVVDIPRCLVLAPALSEVAEALRRALPLPLALSGVDLRLVDRGVLATLIVERAPDPARLARVVQELRTRAPRLVGVALSERDPDAVQMLGRGPELVWGSGQEPHHLAPEAPWHYAVPGAFTQAHPAQAARLHAHVERALERALGGLRARRVLELYAGSGALALRLAARGAQVTAVERFEPALRLVREAAKAQSLTLELRAEDALRFLQQRTGDPGVDAAIVNPPRRGLEPAVRRGLGALAPRVLVYVSCEPRTLARDLAHLARLGLVATSVLPLDMIPLSDALECCALLVPGAPPAPRVLFEDERAIALEKAPFESVTLDPTGAPSLALRAQRTLGHAQLTALHELEHDVSGVCWFAKEPAAAPELARALASAELRFVALASGVSHKKGRVERRAAGRLRYVRRSVLGGHSLLDVFVAGSERAELRRLLASIGHAVLGDPQHGKSASNRHFEHRHGLDRPFLHLAAVSAEALGAGVIEAPLSADLAPVLVRLE
jgi:23S rRNA (uracil1939-C5)-methyltransferase